MNRFLKFYFPIIFITLVSCSSIKNNDNRNNKDNSSILVINNNYINKLEFDANFYVKSSFGEFNLNGDVRIENDNKISVDLFGPFGINVAKIYSDTSQLIVYSIFENIVYTGKPTEDNIFKATGMYLSVNNLIRAMRSELLFPSNEYQKDAILDKGTLYKRIDNRKFADYALVNDLNSIKEYQRKGSENTTMVRIFMDDYIVNKDYKIAKSLNINLPNNDFIIKYLSDNIKVNNEAKLPQKFNIPNNAKIINLN